MSSAHPIKACGRMPPTVMVTYPAAMVTHVEQVHCVRKISQLFTHLKTCMRNHDYLPMCAKEAKPHPKRWPVKNQPNQSSRIDERCM